MTAPLLFRTTNVSVGFTTTVTITHGLSRTPANLHVILTEKTQESGTTAAGHWVSAIGTNTVDVLSNSTNLTLVDVAVIEFHSLYGGPT